MLAPDSSGRRRAIGVQERSLEALPDRQTTRGPIAWPHRRNLLESTGFPRWGGSGSYRRRPGYEIAQRMFNTVRCGSSSRTEALRTSHADRIDCNQFHPCPIHWAGTPPIIMRTKRAFPQSCCDCLALERGSHAQHRRAKLAVMADFPLQRQGFEERDHPSVVDEHIGGERVER